MSSEVATPDKPLEDHDPILVEERRLTREATKPLIALICHGFKQHKTDNAKRAYLATIKRAVYELEYTVLSEEQVKLRLEDAKRRPRERVTPEEDGLNQFGPAL